MKTLKKSPLHSWHEKMGARLVDFHGWELPVSYDGLFKEHQSVRQNAGLFDVSHMGEIRISGPGALEGLQRIVSNDLSSLGESSILYTVACREDGGILDDFLVYKMGEEDYLLVVNASNVEKMYAWCRDRLPSLEVQDHSSQTAQIAVQGPASRGLLSALFPERTMELHALPYYHFMKMEFGEQALILSRTGYTGELGYEMYLPPEMAHGIADRLMDLGADSGLKPAGLGARDTLRFEASYCLYGNELGEETDPFEAGLFWLVKMDKGDFIGRDALRERKQDPSAKRLLGLSLPGRRIARQDFAVFCEDEEVGRVTSGSFAPTLDENLCLALVRRDCLKSDLSVEIRGERVSAIRRKLPFYQQAALRA
ncbi:MAG: glycine cleavage system aminomethyltransferase GcvT [Candidatus Krumholzibacteria bacterium]|jgi:aminomethyltransferase|nr:glycine cleavage system aminomethyltransferase GcvT [Candidatus Krumholzibacteria bacterium]MDP6668723.1 glycine cleavage system aminomethyltransferase GcvT [Candidatus Krumholzibacteria bacterium]MDP6797224.1 glycine cleavage system aminomethyltransferase GcvT [Candidatus Krumholzibacteria bacterium]MDP7021185.1 glycine cleavage system aminomethyltransferase GcvT [Candidatus Krumholzibacteria bacterium]